MPISSPQPSLLKALRSQGALLAASVLTSALLLWPFFANAQPAPPSKPLPPISPGPTPTPLPPTPSKIPTTPLQQPTAIPKPAVAPEPTPTKRPDPTPKPSPSSTPRATPTAKKNEDKQVVTVDVSIRPSREEKFVGQNVINSTGEQQRVAQSQIEGARQRVSFVVRVQNTGTETITYKLLAPASGAGWKVAYFDAVEGGNDITPNITAKTGWSTSSIEAKKKCEIRVEAAPDADKPGKAFRDLLISASTVNVPKIVDAVVAGVGIQKVAGIEYSLDQGVHWKAAPLLEGKPGDIGKSVNSSSLISTAGITVQEGDMIGLRAVPLVPSLPWPHDPEYKPLWHDAGYWNMGETNWVQAKVTQEMISVECGNTLHTRLFVKPAPPKKAAPEKPQPVKIKPTKKYDLDLDVTRISIHVGGGEEGQTTLVATVKDAKGAPLPNLQVRFHTYYAEDTPEGSPQPEKTPAGTLNGDGPEHNLATTDKDGKARILLTSSERESAVIYEAELILADQDKEQLKFPPQMMQFFDEHPELQTNDDDF